jgi:DNA-binding MarR family transcriptional regulator
MPRDLVAQILTAYPVLHHAVRQREVRASAGASVSAHQATILAQLDVEGGRALTEVATAMGVSLPTMSLMIDRLARAGLVDRRRDQSDGRRVSLRLTEAGVRTARSRSLIDRERVQALLARLAPADRAAGVRGLLKLARAARGLPPQSE